MSDRVLKRALFADLELTCWDGMPPAGESAEIIQIGIAEMDLETLAIRRTFSRIVKPTRSKVSPFCEQLTGITPAMAKAGRPFVEVASSARREFGASPWMAWGDDETALKEAAALHGCDSPLPGPQLNIGLMFYQLMGITRRPGLAEALRLMGLEFEGRAHDALTDAINTARLFSAMSRRLRSAQG